MELKAEYVFSAKIVFSVCLNFSLHFQSAIYHTDELYVNFYFFHKERREIIQLNVFNNSLLLEYKRVKMKTGIYVTYLKLT